MRVVILTGISGSGKSVALRELEDDGYFCIDNLPVQFLPEVVMSLQEAGHQQVAVAIDARTQDTLAELSHMVAGMSRFGHDVKVLFLNARTDTLVQRYSESRRRHPMATAADLIEVKGAEPTVIEAIEHEREILSVLEDIGSMIDTSDLHPNVLRKWVRETVGAERTHMTLSFVSFAYKYGVPLDADLVFDARCLPNPYYVQELRALTGRDRPVQDYLKAIPAVQRMIDHITHFVQTWLPHYVQENRSYLTVAVGCTGGQHRSVYCVERLAEHFSRTEHVLIRHRSLANKEVQKEESKR